MSREAKLYYERHLPHWQPLGRELFITWRLAGSLPVAFWRECKETSNGKRFIALDHALHAGRCGPGWLKEPRMAKLVEDALHHGDTALGLYKMVAYVGHVESRASTDRDDRTCAANHEGSEGLHRETCQSDSGADGAAFLQDESFDHWVRNAAERDKIVRYIENNPISAGLSSASRGLALVQRCNKEDGIAVERQ